jgi:hypothetical protein
MFSAAQTIAMSIETAHGLGTHLAELGSSDQVAFQKVTHLLRYGLDSPARLIIPSRLHMLRKFSSLPLFGLQRQRQLPWLDN